MKKKWFLRGVGMLMACCMLSLGGCTGYLGVGSKESGGSGEGEKVIFSLDWSPNPNHTGIYVARELGYYEQEGLSVEVQVPSEDGATALVAAGKADMGIDFQDYLASAFSAQNKLPVTAIAAILQHNTSGIISLKKSGIKEPKDMEGHTYATASMPIEQAIIREIVPRDEKVKFIPTMIEDVKIGLENEVDALWVYYGSEKIMADYLGLETNFFYMKDIKPEYDYYSPVIIGNNDFLAKRPECARAFLRATEKGYRYAIEHPQKAAEILVKQVPTLLQEAITQSQEYLAEEYMAEEERWGYIDAERWNGFFEWVNNNVEGYQGEGRVKISKTFTNEYLSCQTEEKGNQPAEKG